MKTTRLIKLLLAIILLIHPIVMMGGEPEKELKLGLVLSGGGAKGFAHIGVLRVLEEENIPVSLISGTSIGNIIGALYSVGYSPDEIEDFAKRQDWRMLLTDDIDHRLKSRYKQNFDEKYPLELILGGDQKRLALPGGLVQGNNILNLFCGMTADYSGDIDFMELPIPFSNVVYDLVSASEVVINKGDLAKAILTSMAIPGIFSPVDYDGMKCVDGGVINNFPVDVAIDMGADLTIGVDLKQEEDIEHHYNRSITHILRGLVGRLEDEKHQQNLERVDVVMNPDLQGITALDFEDELVDLIIKSGEEAARRQMPEIKKLIAGKKIVRNNVRTVVPADQWHITQIITPEQYAKESNIFLMHLGIIPGQTYTMAQIDQAVKRIYGYGNFHMVYYKLKTNDTGYTLEFLIDNKKEKALKVGGALNTVDIATIYANFSRIDYSSAVNLLMLDTKIARNPQLLFMAETNRLLSTSGFKVRGRYNRMDYFDDLEELTGRMKTATLSSSLYTYRRFRDVADLSIGVEEAYFYSNDYYRQLTGNKNSRVNRLYTKFYTSLVVDTRNRSFIPDHGMLLNAGVSLLTETKDFRKFIPVANLKIDAVIPVGDLVAFTTNLHHQTIINNNATSLYYGNYSSNRYNAFTDFYIPLLGQSRVTVLDDIATMGEIGLRMEVAPNHYIIPKVQLLWQMDKWSDINFDRHHWSGGITYQHRSKVTRLEFTLGYSELLGKVHFNGGLGYQF